MTEPMVAADGHTYEKDQIVKWLQKHDTSPMTGLKLKKRILIHNLTLKKAIQSYKEKMIVKGIRKYQ